MGLPHEHEDVDEEDEGEESSTSNENQEQGLRTKSQGGPEPASTTVISASLSTVETPYQAPNLSRTSAASKEQLREWYNHFGRMAIPGDDMFIVHKGGPHWVMVLCLDSAYGQVAKLRGVWWLDVSAVLYGVPRGSYRVQWGLVVENPTAVVATQFRSPTWDNTQPNASSFIAESMREFIGETDNQVRNLFVPGRMNFQLPERLVVEQDHQTIFVQFRNHRGTYKSGLSVDYVRLLREDDPRVFSPVPITDWDDSTSEDGDDRYY
ncbi:hypothetical protein BGX23_008124 [Mortierella sp. AD031]|nr:hypothetical protein BGX23_008124 [Mortierella sp. AD031]